MAQTTLDQFMEQSQGQLEEPCLHYTIKANETIPMGTLAMQVIGNLYAETYKANTTNCVILGVAAARYVETTGSNYTRPNDSPMVFLRGAFKHFQTDGTITVDDIGALIGFKDNHTIGHTVAAHDGKGLLLAIDQRLRSGQVRYTTRIIQSGPT